MNKAGKIAEKSAVELCDEGVFLLRNAPAGCWAAYYAGTMPFLLGLLYFWSDMTRGHPGIDLLILESGLLAALFIWMKVWHVIFALQLRNRLTDSNMDQLGATGLRRIVLEQARLQPTGLVVLPFAAVLTFPLGWVYAYFQNLVTLPSPGDSPGLLHKKAIVQAQLWPKQNHLLLLIVSGLGLVIFANVLITLLLLPQLLITFFGVKEVFHPSPWLALNTTFLALVVAITHLILDPFIKALYVLRCFYGQSRATGEDLRVRLNRAAAGRTSLVRIAAAVLVVSFAAPAARGAAAEPTHSPQQLAEEISAVLKQPEYNWRFPREVIQDENKGPVAAFFEGIARAIQRGTKAFFRWVERAIDWFRNLWRNDPSGRPGSGWSLGNPKVLLYITLVLVAGAVGILLWRNRGMFRARQAAVISRAVPAVPDLRDENVSADSLPEDEWLKLANELFAQGELRLAIRALFLAALADLARRQIVSLAKFKSNREYERELRRRSLAVPERSNSFAVLVSIYERVWYGMYHPSHDMFAECESNVRTLKSC